MSVSVEYKEFIKDLLLPFGDVTIRSMFGGGGVYFQGIMFALIAEEALYLKADHSNIPDFESEGAAPFIYQGKSGKPIQMSYWQTPERLYEDPDEMKLWALKAFQVARTNKKPKKTNSR